MASLKPHPFPINQKLKAESKKQLPMLPRSSAQKRIYSVAAVDPYMFDSITGSTQKRNRLPNLSTGQLVTDDSVAVTVSTPVNISKISKEKEVITPIRSVAMKKANGSICQKTSCEVEGAEDELQTKSSAYCFPNHKKRSWSSKGSFKRFVMPQDFIDQQKAYFKEIDEYELDVEEVE